MSFRKYLDGLAKADNKAEREYLDYIGDPYKIRDNTEPGTCNICGYGTYIRDIIVHIPEEIESSKNYSGSSLRSPITSEEVIGRDVNIIVSHANRQKPEFCLSVYKEKTKNCKNLENMKSFPHLDRLKKTLELRIQNNFTDKDDLREWYSIINYDIV